MILSAIAAKLKQRAKLAVRGCRHRSVLAACRGLVDACKHDRLGRSPVTMMRTLDGLRFKEIHFR